MTTVDIAELQRRMVCPESKALWTFGYASLVWRPGFEWSARVVGRVRGYRRVFYQGTTTHRGTEAWPGRVATLVRDKNSDVWGVGYEVKDEQAIINALKHLAEREMITGGYHFDKVTFYPHKSELKPFKMAVYIADEENLQYLGDGGSLEVQAYQIAKAEGVCGKNSEYVKKVVDFMLNEVGRGQLKMYDKYLYDLYELIKAYEEGSIVPSEHVLDIVPLLVKEATEDTDYKEFKRRSSA